nr:uncharacterized protein LOC113708174 [Coffea arabica]
MIDPKFEVGQIFTCKQLFMKACKSHGVVHGRKIKFSKNDGRRATAYCKDCSWKVSTAVMLDKKTFQIKSMQGKHSCGRTFDHGLANSTFLVDRYKKELAAMADMKVNTLTDKVKTDVNVNISRWQAYRTKKKAESLVNGEHEAQYNKLRNYCREVKRANPGSNVFMTTVEDDEGEDRFERLYICLNACKTGFLSGCRPVVGLDGCHLRGPHKGVLLTAVGIDPNDQLYPIAYAVVEIENKLTWKWFVGELLNDLQIRDENHWTIITDKQKGLIQAIQELLPDVEHRMCVRHMYNNFKKLHGGLALKERIWALARAPYKNLFKALMEALKAVDEGAFQWLVDNTTPQQWSRAYFRTSPKCDILLNNLCESFNSSILEARERPILGMLETIRLYLMVRMENKREWMQKYTGKVCPKILKKLEKVKTASSACIATPSGDWNYEVRCMYGDRYTVNLASRTCSCRRWELNGIPCAHAISAIALTKESPENFVHECYSKEAYMKAYGPIIYPLNGEHLWKDLKQGPVLPPETIKLPGRPKKVRRKEPDEPPATTTSQGQTKRLSRVGLMDYKCRKCKQKGHNSRKCPSSHDQENVQQQATAITSSSQSQQQTPNTMNPGANKQSQPQQSNFTPEAVFGASGLETDTNDQVFSCFSICSY